VPRRSATAGVAGLLLALCACAGGKDHPLTAKVATSGSEVGTRVTVSVSSCGGGWKSSAAGLQHFTLVNTDTRSGEVSLTDAHTGAVYADVEPLGPGTSNPLTITLAAGHYRFLCAMEDEDTIQGVTATVTGKLPAGEVAIKPVQPVTQTDLIPATLAYEKYVRAQIPRLISQVDALDAAVRSGDRAAAQRAWLAGHLEYERLGAAYDAFGDLDGEINGLPAGPNDHDWSGFHLVEQGLWHSASLASVRPATDALTAAVRQLQQQMANAQIDPLQISIRAHEITENALQFELTGRTDFGSNSNLATVQANLAGTATVLKLIQPLLAGRYAQLPQTQATLQKAQQDLGALSGADGTLPALTALSRPQRELIDSDISELSELLAPIASILEPRRASS
jgi:iron uptake system component EfeO